MKRIHHRQIRQLCGLSLQMIHNCKVNGHYPKRFNIYVTLTFILGYENKFFHFPKMKGLFFVHGKSTAIPIREISKNWSPVCLRFFDGELPENDKVIVMRTLQSAYWISKERNIANVLQQNIGRANTLCVPIFSRNNCIWRNINGT